MEISKELEGILKDLVSGVHAIKSSSDIDKDLVAELKKTVTDHDRALVLMAKAVEDMNRNSQEMTSVFKEFQKQTVEAQRSSQEKMFTHWQNQDRLMIQVEAVLKELAKNEPRLAQIEQRQISGCPSFLNFKEARAVELKHWEDVKKTLTEVSLKNKEDIYELKEKCEVHTEKIKVVNARTEDLETITTNQTKEFNTWKEGIYKALIAYGVSLIGAIITAVWGAIK